ncbi:type I-E CRISPR-associated protein Cse1/CasA [Streptomyces bluensis]
MQFNLATEPWIPVLRQQGQVAQVSLQTALLDAHKIQSLVPPIPTMVPALLRQVLLPVTLHALGAPRSPDEWQRRFAQGQFSTVQQEELRSYLLQEHLDDLDLLSTTRPFAQVAELTATNNETKPTSLLMPGVASGNNVPLFSALTEADTPELTPAEAALWLLHTHCWDTAAIKTGAKGDPQVKAGKTTGNPTGPLGQLGVIVPMGRTLYETLILNQPYRYDGLATADRPHWAAATEKYPLLPGETDARTPQWSTRAPRGEMDLMTWQSRRIRLIPANTPDGIRITSVVVSAGDRLENTPEYEPHTAWTCTAKPAAGRPPQRPRRHLSGRSAWQGLDTLLALALPTDGDGRYTSVLLRQIGELEAEGHLPPGYPLRLATYGLEYGNQSAVVENAITDSMPLPTASLAAENSDVRAALLEAAGQADRASRATDRLLMDLRRAGGGEPLPRDKGNRPSQRLLYTLDPSMRLLLAQLRDVGDDIDLLEEEMTQWETTAWRAAWSLAEQLLVSAPPQAFGGRDSKEGTFRTALAERGLRSALYAVFPRAAEARRLPTEVTTP